MNTKFPIHISPFKDEVLTSWLLRLSSGLHTKYHTLCDFTFGERVSADTRDLDINITKEHLEQIRKYTYLSFAELNNLTVNSYYPYLSTDPNLYQWVLPRNSYHRISRNNFTVICPSCFRKDEVPYFRKNWRLTISFICSDCNIYHVDECPECNSPIDYLRLDVGRKEKILRDDLCVCNNCEFDFRNIKGRSAERKDLANQLRINKYLEKGYTEELMYSHLFFDILDLLMSVLKSSRKNLIGLDIEVSRQMGVETSYDKVASRKKIKNLSIRQRHSIFQKAMWLLGMDNGELISFLRRSNVPGCFFQFEKKETPYWFNRLVKEELSKKYFNWKSVHKEYNNASSYNRLAEILISKF